MFHPAHIDGRRLVVLRMLPGFFANRFEVVCGGRLSHDGERLALVDDDNRELAIITDEQLSRIQIIRPENRIRECIGYEFFIIANDETLTG